MEHTLPDQSTEIDSIPEGESEPIPPLFTVADGFRFGCGFILASVTFAFLSVIALAIFIVLTILFDIPLPFNMRF